jgi:hypothetical protein
LAVVSLRDPAGRGDVAALHDRLREVREEQSVPTLAMLWVVEEREDALRGPSEEVQSSEITCGSGSVWREATRSALRRHVESFFLDRGPST